MKKWTVVHWQFDYDQSGWEYYETEWWIENQAEEEKYLQEGWGGYETNIIQLRTRALKWHMRRCFSYLPKYPEHH